MSASDSIRTKWAYYVGLANATAELEQSHRWGFLVMDEPRQQEAELESVGSLYAALSRVAEHSQVIVASSAAPAELDQLLGGLSARRIASRRAHMFSNLVS